MISRTPIVAAPTPKNASQWNPITLEDTNGQYSFSVRRLAAGESIDLSSDSDRGVFVVRGASEILGTDLRELHEREFVSAIHGVPLSLRQLGDDPTTLAILSAKPADSRGPANDSPPHVVGAREGIHVSVVGDHYRFLALSEATRGSYSLWEATVPPGGGPPPHLHTREEEGFFVLEGEIVFRVEDQTLPSPAGTAVNLPIGVKHAFRNESKADARMLIWVAPAGLEQNVFETGTAVSAGEAPLPPSPDEIRRLLAAAPRYGVVIFPPEHH